MKEKLVPSTWLEASGHRLDCGPYLSGALEAKILLGKLKARKDPLEKLTEGGRKGVFHAGREGRTYVLDKAYGVGFLGSTDILAADLSSIPLISSRQVASTPKFSISKDWILVTRSGTVGRMAFARPDMDGLACSEHVLRVVADKNAIQPGYLFAYLSSRFGVPLIVSGTYGSIIQHIEPDHIAELPVPRFGDDFERKVHDKVSGAAKLRADYQAQICTATDKLFSSVGLSDITSGSWHGNTHDLGFVRKLDSFLVIASRT